MGRTLPRGRHRPAGLDSIHSQGVLYGATWGLYLVSDLLYLIPFVTSMWS